MGLKRGESGLGHDNTLGGFGAWGLAGGGSHALGVWLRRLGGTGAWAYLFGRKLPGAHSIAVFLEREGRMGLSARARHARPVQDAIGLAAKVGGIASADAIAAVQRDGAARRLACGLPSNELVVSACRRDAVIRLGLGLAGSRGSRRARALSSPALLRELTWSRAPPNPRHAPCPTSWYACACARRSG